MTNATSTLRLVAHFDVAAASGIAERAGQLYVIADDALELAVYDLQGARVQSIALVQGALPAEHAARKAAKPDFEALVALPDGSLLALGSGSTTQRQRGAWVQFGERGHRVATIDLGDLYAALEAELPELNIEGGAVFRGQLYLCSRGNGARRDNALVHLDLTRALATLRDANSLNADCFRGIRRVELGELEDVPLSLTDLAVHGGSLLFSAAAEASANTYDDGTCTGSVVGQLSSDGATSELTTIPARVKIEGICSANATELYAVADADDPNAKAPLYLVQR